jgi:molybdopterin synthase catalytic subunit
MQVEIELTTRPIDLRRELPRELVGAAGAVVEFQGIVRAEEAGQAVAALEYEAYSPMAERVMRRIAEDAGRRYGCLFMRVTHRIGVVPLGEAAIHVVVAARHRAEALALVTEFMDKLKQDVPIWKVRAVHASEVATPKQQ